MVAKREPEAGMACEPGGRIRRIAVGIVVDGDGSGARILITQRLAGPQVAFGGFWEFPGGKVEPGETVAQAVQRELREEVGLEVEVGRPLPPIDHVYRDGPIRLEAVICRLVGAGEPRALEVAQWRWAAVGELERYRFPPANAALVAELKRAYGSEPGG